MSLKASSHLLDHKIPGNALVPGVPETKGSLSTAEDQDDENDDEEDEDVDEDKDEAEDGDYVDDDEAKEDRRGVGGGAGRRDGGRVLAVGHRDGIAE